MPMAAKGLAKLIEECGELQQVAGKKLAYYTTDTHPDGALPLSTRLSMEIADVMAAAEFVAKHHGLDSEMIKERKAYKLALFEEWHADPDNNADGIDAGPVEDRHTDDVR